MNSIKLIKKNMLIQSLISDATLHYGKRFNQIFKGEQYNQKLRKITDSQDATIYITDSAINRLKKILNDNEFLRVSIETGGCKGFNYLFEIAKKIDSEDKIFQLNSSKIVIDSESYSFLKDSILDYDDELIKSSFRIKNNPQNSESCSCGISFSPKKIF